jgi:hypothetical protein
MGQIALPFDFPFTPGWIHDKYFPIKIGQNVYKYERPLHCRKAAYSKVYD